MAKVGVILSGAGYLDGAEITEAVLTLYFLDRAGAQVQCYAPNKDQLHVVNHLTGEPTRESRNVLTESARIARGKIQDLKKASMASLDALVMPGGFGAAKNLSDFASKGAECAVDPDLARLVAEAAKAKKPIVAICISPAVLAAALKKAGLSAKLTIGDDADTAAAIAKLGSTHEKCPVTSAVVDETNRVISTPAYMYDAGRKDIGTGIEAAIVQLMKWLA